MTITPRLVLDRRRLDANIADMAATVRRLAQDITDKAAAQDLHKHAEELERQAAELESNRAALEK